MGGFIDPLAGNRTASAPVLVFQQERDVQLPAGVTVGFKNDFDAGVLFVHRSADSYARLWLPSGEAMVYPW